MIPAPTPANELQRLAALLRLRLLDCVPDSNFEAITQCVALATGAPIALISLVDAERQWFMCRVGLDARETPRDISFCGHAIMADKPLIVPDAHRDARFADNPLVTGEPKIWATVVGVVAHVRHRNPVEEVRDQVYFSQRQVLRNPSVYIVRTIGDPAAIVPSVREALKRVDAALPIYDVRPLMAYVDGANATRGFTMRLAVIFALVALTLASVGIYGVVAYSVTLRHREFGVRRALGAGAAQVIALVARDGARLLTRGIVAGLAGAALVAWFLRGLLFGVSPWDVTIYAAAVPVLLIAGLIACLLPARRALAANPVDALRAE